MAAQPRSLFQRGPDGPELSGASRALTAQLEKIRAVRKNALRERPAAAKKPETSRGARKPAPGKLKPT
jgi:hypothetical protein